VTVVSKLGTVVLTVPPSPTPLPTPHPAAAKITVSSVKAASMIVIERFITPPRSGSD
jgi:hypothetical protein